MQQRPLIAGFAVLALVVSAQSASAACIFEHPVNTVRLGRIERYTSISAGLVPAFVSCQNPGGNTANGATEGGVPSCALPVTFNQSEGLPAGGWQWNENRSKGYVRIYPTRNRLESPLNPPSDTVDLAVTMNLRSIIDEVGPADGPGTLSVLLRMTLDDRANGPMTLIDFPLTFPFMLNNGNVSLRSTVNARLNAIGHPGLPGCASLEILSVLVHDEHGNVFANIGTFIPPLQ